MEALHDIVRAGKARYIGASSMFAWQFAKAQHVAESRGWSRFVSMQNHYNLVYREEEREMIPQCLDMGVGVIPWSPLARGLLAGKPVPGRGAAHGTGEQRPVRRRACTRDGDFDMVDNLRAVAQAKGLPPAQVALAWLLHKPGVTAPIVGATKIEHLEDAIAAVDVTLTDDEITQLEQAYVPHPVLGHS